MNPEDRVKSGRTASAEFQLGDQLSPSEVADQTAFAFPQATAITGTENVIDDGTGFGALRCMQSCIHEASIA